MEKPILARMKRSVSKPEGLRCFFQAQLEWKNGEVSVLPIAGQASFKVSSVHQADSWVVFPEKGSVVSEGTLVEVYQR
jgi:molybdopterin biosynthesis enzyme